jgi:DNA topoisomerase-2
VYQKKTQLEHILLRPDTFVGSVESVTEKLWVKDPHGPSLVQREVTFVPGLYKIVDEIIVNALDNRQRDPSMDRLDVVCDQATGLISVLNNGKGIPVEIHKEEKIYIPELIFGHLLTGSNYDDSEERVTGGRNGFGAKLTNIFSTEFTVETADSERARKFVQTFRNNMSTKTEPKVTAFSGGSDYTKVSFRPDLARFGMQRLDDDIAALIAKRVFDAAGTNPKLKVTLNGERVPVRTFQEYSELYLGARPDKPRIYERIDDRWEVLVSVSDGQFEQVSFVNGICTTKGGQHVNYLADQITKDLVEIIKKKNKNAPIKPFQIKNYLSLFVNCKIVNPSFDSQTKETLTTTSSKFGSKPVVPEAMLKKIAKCGIVDEVLNFARFKSESLLKKNDGAKRERVLGIPKLDDANNAGGRRAMDCTLIITEGDSAKSLAIAGLAVVGRDNYGVFPLRGKLLNVREATTSQIQENAEITNLKKILGLKHGVKYTDAKALQTLRYGHLMIMTDQDQDGSHIKGLIINFLHHFWPELLQVNGFLCEFITPIVKVVKGGAKGVTRSFFTLPEYQTWRESLGDAGARGWTVKYYKGLGTSTAAEAKEYFSNLARHKIDFVWDGEENARDIELAFSKKLADARKDWLRAYEPGTFLDQNVDQVGYSDFINKELILFSLSDNVRSIPSIMDGLKPGQRKILFACFKRKLRGEIKVAQLVGYVAEQSAYHHGEVSLMSTIVGMAQNYVGSNNINLLEPNGQFGTRLQGGKDSASPRYIFTNLSPITRALFPEVDDAVLKQLEDDGQMIEPEWYAPVLPMVLVNGAEGIGTGWSTSVPCYSPKDIIDNLRHLLSGEDLEPMVPWYRGFRGTIAPQVKDPGCFTVSGVIEKTSDTTLEITELPLGTWTQNYKEFLESLLQANVAAAAGAGSKKDGDDAANKDGKDKEKGESARDAALRAAKAADKAFCIQSYKEHHTESFVHFTVTLSAENMAHAEQMGLHKRFKLVSSCNTSNMVLFDASGRIHKYESPLEILQTFFVQRLRVYELRRRSLIDKASAQYDRLENKVKFVKAVISGDFKIANRRKDDLVADLARRGFTPLPSDKQLRRANKQQSSADADDDGDDDEDNDATDGNGISKDAKGAAARGSFDYLLGMPLWSLTFEKVQQLERERDVCQVELDRLISTTKESMWEADLTRVEAAVDEFLVAAEQETVKASQIVAKKKAPARKAPAKKSSKKMAIDDDDDQDDDDDEDEDDDIFEDDDDDDFEEKPQQKKPAFSSFATKKPAPAKVTKNDDEDEDSDAPILKKPATAAAAAKPAAKPAAVKKPVNDGDDSDSDAPILKAKKPTLSAKPRPAATATATATATAAAAAAKSVPMEGADDDGSDDVFGLKPSTKKLKTATGAAKRPLAETKSSVPTSTRPVAKPSGMLSPDPYSMSLAERLALTLKPAAAPSTAINFSPGTPAGKKPKVEATKKASSKPVVSKKVVESISDDDVELITLSDDSDYSVGSKKKKAPTKKPAAGKGKGKGKGKSAGLSAFPPVQAKASVAVSQSAWAAVSAVAAAAKPAKKKLAATTTLKPLAKKASSARVELSDIDSDSDNGPSDMTAAPASRSKRAAASKPKSYAFDDEDTDEDMDDDDVWEASD